MATMIAVKKQKQGHKTNLKRTVLTLSFWPSPTRHFHLAALILRSHPTSLTSSNQNLSKHHLIERSLNITSSELHRIQKKSAEISQTKI